MINCVSFLVCLIIPGGYCCVCLAILTIPRWWTAWMSLKCALAVCWVCESKACLGGEGECLGVYLCNLCGCVCLMCSCLFLGVWLAGDLPALPLSRPRRCSDPPTLCPNCGPTGRFDLSILRGCSGLYRGPGTNFFRIKKGCVNPTGSGIPDVSHPAGASSEGEGGKLGSGWRETFKGEDVYFPSNFGVLPPRLVEPEA